MIRRETLGGFLVLNFTMRFLITALLFTLAVAGCTTRSKSRLAAQNAWLTAQNRALQQAAQFNGVTVVGPVQTPQVPWVVGLTLGQAIATANYLDANEPRAIIITRQGESAWLDPKDLINGAVVPLEPGDVVEIRP